MSKPLKDWEETDYMIAVYALRQAGLISRAHCSSLIESILDGHVAALAGMADATRRPEEDAERVEF